MLFKRPKTIYRMLKCRDKTRFTYLSAAAASIEPADDEGTEFTNAALYEHGQSGLTKFKQTFGLHIIHSVCFKRDIVILQRRGKTRPIVHQGCHLMKQLSYYHVLYSPIFTVSTVAVEVLQCQESEEERGEWCSISGQHSLLSSRRSLRKSPSKSSAQGNNGVTNAEGRKEGQMKVAGCSRAPSSRPSTLCARHMS